MRAARVTEKGCVGSVDVPDPEPVPGQVLLRVRKCGICGSDLHIVRNGWQQAGLGHEMSAVVERTGGQEGNLSEGTRVCAECYTCCGRCAACKNGNHNLCESISFMGGHGFGAMAELVTVAAGSVVPVPRTFSDDDTVMVEPLAVAWRAVRRAGAERGRSIGIIGAGTIGLLCAAAARVCGASPVIVLARHAHQAAAARELGVDKAVLIGQEKPTDALRSDGGKLDAVLDTVAQGTSFSTALACVRPAGRVVVLGEPARPVLSALSPLVHGEVQVTGSFCYGITDGVRDFEQAMALIESGRVNAASLVTHTVPFDQIERAFAIAADKSSGCIKVTVGMGF